MKPAPGGTDPKMIEIPVGKPGETRAPRPHDPHKYWGDYFKRLDETPAQLLETVGLLRREERLDEIEACLRAYLTYRIKRAEPWMYEMLAVSIERRKGSPAEVKTILGYAAYKALQTHNPNHLLSVADMLHRRGIYDKVGPAKETSAGELIDLTTKLLPHRAEPLLMSMLVATKTKDPARMTEAVDKALSLGWPGSDDPMRRNARSQVESLAKALREDGRDKEADSLLAQLPAMLARDLYVRLSWDGVDDIDLIVDEPLGATAQLFKMPRTIFGGAIVTNGFGKHPEEIYVCPRAFSGTYKVRIDKVFQPDKNPAKVASLEIITHEGTPEEKRETRTIDLASPETVEIKLENGRRKEVLPFLAPTPAVALDAKLKPKPVAPESAKPQAITKPGAAIKP